MKASNRTFLTATGVPNHTPLQTSPKLPLPNSLTQMMSFASTSHSNRSDWPGDERASASCLAAFPPCFGDRCPCRRPRPEESRDSAGDCGTLAGDAACTRCIICDMSAGERASVDFTCCIMACIRWLPDNAACGLGCTICNCSK